MKKLLLTLSLVAMMAGSAFAIVDDGVSSLGMYFDNAGNTNCFAPTPGAPFNVYFIMANPAVANMGGFEFAWRFNPPVVPEPFILGTTLPPQALNIGNNYNFIVGLGGGLVTSEATVLVTLQMLALAPVAANTLVQVGPATPASIPGHAAFNDFNNPANIIPMNFSTVVGPIDIDAHGWVVPGVAAHGVPRPDRDRAGDLERREGPVPVVLPSDLRPDDPASSEAGSLFSPQASNRGTRR